MNAFALVRPPGHHSGFRNVINGFCVYNNVAIGAKYLQNSNFYLI
jgi:histone deacetylase 6